MTEKPRLSLDFDGVLAETHEAAFDLMLGGEHEYSVEDISTWQWGVDRFGYDRYLTALWHVSQLRPDELQPIEANLPGRVAALHDHFHVDIVTAHPEREGITEAKRSWLARHNVNYDELVVVPMGESKTGLDYDYFIDDKPTVPENAAEEQTVFLYDRPYNQDVDGDFIRVDGLLDVVKYAKVQDIRQNIAEEVRDTLVEALNDR